MRLFLPAPRQGLRRAGLAACVVGLVACGGGADPMAGAPVEVGQQGRGRAVSAKASAEAAPGDDDALEARYLAARELLAGRAAPTGIAAERVRADLEQIANSAADPHLRANASLLLGSLEEGAGRAERAVALYRHAARLVPDDAGPSMALALALAGTRNWAEAAEAQLRAATLDPDNLENWLLLGEMRTKGGDKDGAVEAYAAYELRRKGLLDGLTLRAAGEEQAGGAPGAGEYRLGPEDRARCALALSVATDQGTARGLLYALATDPSPVVRRAVAEAMGLQRLEDYAPPLERSRAQEADPQARAAMEAALAQIRRAPVRPDPGDGPPRAARSRGRADR